MPEVLETMVFILKEDIVERLDFKVGCYLFHSIQNLLQKYQIFQPSETDTI